LRQTVCSTFSRSGWNAARSASLAKGRTSEKRPSPSLHKASTWSNKASPGTFQMALLVDGGEWSPQARSLYPRGYSPSTSWTGGRVGPRNGTDAMAKENNSLSCRESNTSCSARRLVTIMTELPRLPTTQTHAALCQLRREKKIRTINRSERVN
jgi:hypothetical protein